MERIAKFHKISYEQFEKDWLKTNPNLKDHKDGVRYIYDNIKLPQRGTTGSAGYDFFAPYGFSLMHQSSRVIPTGVRCEFFDPSWFLNIVPRSGQGFKYGIHLANTCGVIDSDYFNADNEGHIMIKIVHESIVGEPQMFSVNAGEAFTQGIFMPYGITIDDDVTEKRTGGFGSTSQKGA